MPYVEMGQGTYTSIPMLIAEELEVDLSRCGWSMLRPTRSSTAIRCWAVQATGNSNAVRAAWQPLRQAGATARAMLVAAAARRWNVDPASCRAQSGEVLHRADGKTLAYGELAADAARMPVPDNVALKRAAGFQADRHAGQAARPPAKVNGTAVFGIDVRPPGVKIATLAQSPVFGGRVKSVDDAAAKAVKGVRQIVRLDDAVAVVADHMGAAKKGLAALVIEWDDGPHAKLGTDASAPSSSRRRSSRARSRRTSAMPTRRWRAPSPGSRRPTRFRSSRTRRMEPMNCTVHVRKDGCEIWVGSQALARAQSRGAAKTAGLPLDKVVVHNHLIGGGFGRRLETD